MKRVAADVLLIVGPALLAAWIWWSVLTGSGVP